MLHYTPAVMCLNAKFTLSSKQMASALEKRGNRFQIILSLLYNFEQFQFLASDGMQFFLTGCRYHAQTHNSLCTETNRFLKLPENTVLEIACLCSVCVWSVLQFHPRIFKDLCCPWSNIAIVCFSIIDNEREKKKIKCFFVLLNQAALQYNQNLYWNLVWV